MFFAHDRCARESGHDTTFRWRREWYGPDRCADFVTVDLDSLLYRLERDMAEALDAEFDGRLHGVGTADEWRKAADRRRRAMLEVLWDEDAGAFFDFDTVAGDRHPYVSATALYPLWADRGTGEHRLLTAEMLERLLDSTLRPLTEPGGIAASAKPSRGPISDFRPARQWDYPHGWAPHQVLAWHGLVAHGRDELAASLAYRWLYSLPEAPPTTTAPFPRSWAWWSGAST